MSVKKDALSLSDSTGCSQRVMQNASDPNFYLAYFKCSVLLCTISATGEASYGLFLPLGGFYNLHRSGV